jgi:two-component system cell cycle sensor histidine kinase/response regulator CckA
LNICRINHKQTKSYDKQRDGPQDSLQGPRSAVNNQEDLPVAKKPTYEQMNQKIKNLEKESARHRQVEEKLRVSEEKYRSILENMQEGYWEVDLPGNFTFINASIAKFMGYSQDELIGMNNRKYTTPEMANKIYRAFNQVYRTGQPINIIDYEVLAKDGRKIVLEGSISLIHDKSGQPIGFRGINRDVTKRKQVEKALKQSEEKVARFKKMESLGLLAGGVAHDLNNILSGITSYPELLLLDMPKKSKYRKPIETIQESGHRAAAIVDDLLTVARGVATTKDPLDLNGLISSYLHSPEFNKLKQFHPLAAFKTSLDRDLLNVSGSYVHIRKALMNLVSNASEAIEDSGNVTISTMNSNIDRPLRGYDDVNTGEFVILSVSDEGSGISSDDLERIFEPFYTKKIMGRSGTGLGLAVVWNVVQDHKGYIDVKTGEDGTTFVLYFPVTSREISDRGSAITIDDFKGNAETILVVDDVESQREISCRMLDTLGYKTIAVSSGEGAVEYLKENSVDLLLLDMIMDPGINGRETYARVRRIHPNQKAIIISGFTETDDVKKAQKLGAGKYIKKPVTLEKLGMALKEELEK